MPGLLGFFYADTSDRRMAAHNNLCISSFNCRSLKSSITEISNLCNVNDLVFIQEHWLLPYELNMLNNLHADFLAVGKSAVDVTNNVLIGRPYGGRN